MIRLVVRLLSLVPNAEGTSERRLIALINGMIGAETRQGDVNQVSF
jgi:hypothetical protein